MKIKEPIITSLLDDDLYKFTMGQFVFCEFPSVRVTYKFINRGNTKFPDGFADELNHQVHLLCKLKFTEEEICYLNKFSYFRTTYIEWLRKFQLDSNDVVINQKDGDLSIQIHGLWYEKIFWEVKLMALISELYFKLTNQFPDDSWFERIDTKASKLSIAGCNWIDFGTRRRFSQSVQDELVKRMKCYKGFRGTSNLHLSMKHNVAVHGTCAHESFMALQALYGAKYSNKMWLEKWSKHFNGELGIALTDTLTTDVFLKDFDSYYARLFDGVRQDSGDPIEWGNKMIYHYSRLGIDSTNKKFVFSDSLNDNKYIKIHNYFKDVCKPIGGIGTFFTNDVGVTPLNMVVKMTHANFGNGVCDVVKLSDTSGKHNGESDVINRVKVELGLI